MKDSNKEIKFGDMVEIDFTKDLPDGKSKYYHMECKFLPELLPIFLDCDVIEEVEVNEEDFEDGDTDIKNQIMEVLESVSDAVQELQDSNEKALKAQEESFNLNNS